MTNFTFPMQLKVFEFSHFIDLFAEEMTMSQKYNNLISQLDFFFLGMMLGNVKVERRDDKN